MSGTFHWKLSKYPRRPSLTVPNQSSFHISQVCNTTTRMAAVSWVGAFAFSHDTIYFLNRAQQELCKVEPARQGSLILYYISCDTFHFHSISVWENALFHRHVRKVKRHAKKDMLTCILRYSIMVITFLSHRLHFNSTLIRFSPNLCFILSVFFLTNYINKYQKIRSEIIEIESFFFLLN